MQYTHLLSKWPIYFVLAAVATLSSISTYGQEKVDTTDYYLDSLIQTEFVPVDEIPPAPFTPADSVDSSQVNPKKKGFFRKALKKASKAADALGRFARSDAGRILGATAAPDAPINKFRDASLKADRVNDRDIKPIIHDLDAKTRETEEANPPTKKRP